MDTLKRVEKRIVPDSRVGKEIRGPSPLCPYCLTVMDDVIDDYHKIELKPFWMCGNCGAMFEIVN